MRLVWNFLSSIFEVIEFTQSQSFGFFSTKTESISMPKFIDFMNEKQRDPRLNEMLFPSYGEKRCMEIIKKHEPEEENRKASK